MTKSTDTQQFEQSGKLSGVDQNDDLAPNSKKQIGHLDASLENVTVTGIAFFL